MKKSWPYILLCAGLACPGVGGAQQQENAEQSTEATQKPAEAAQKPADTAQQAAETTKQPPAGDQQASGAPATEGSKNEATTDSDTVTVPKKPSVVHESSDRKRRRPKRNSGYDYEHSRYLSRSSERHSYRFNADGEPVSSEKSKKGRSEEEAPAEGGLALGAVQPKQKLQKIDMRGHKLDSEQSADANAGGQIPPGMLPPGMNLGNLMKQGNSGH